MSILSRIKQLWAKGVKYPGYGGGAYGGRVFADEFAEFVALRSKVDYSTVRADLSSAVMACVSTVARTLPAAPLRVFATDKDGQMDPVENHPLPMLVSKPNEYMAGRQLLSWLVADYLVSGNAYLIKERTGRGVPMELWPMPAALMRPRWPDSGDPFIEYYEYWVNGVWYRVETSEVVHFRYGIEWDAPYYGRCGRSPLKAVLRDVYIDEAAADFSAALMRNMGLPGVVFTPEGPTPLAVDKDTREAFLADYQKRFTGDERGKAMFLHVPMKLNQIGFDPEKLTLREIRQIVEERVSAALNVPAISAGLGAGLARSTMKNTEEADRQLWQNCIMPLQSEWAEVLTRSLLPDFGRASDRLTVGFDYKNVKALQEDEGAIRQRNREDFAAGGLSHHQWLGRLGLQPAPGADDFYFFPNTGAGVPLTEMPSAPTPPEPTPAPDVAPTAKPPAKMLTADFLRGYIAAKTDDDATPTPDDWPKVREILDGLDVPGLAELLDGGGE